MSDLHIQWPVERFYWAVLDASALPGTRGWRSGGRLKQLGYLFENVIPGVAIEDIQTIYRRLPGPGRRYVACGVPRARLREDLNPEAVTLGPEALPEFVDEALDPSELNVLSGMFLPPAVRGARRCQVLSAVVILATCCVLLTVGVERRARSAAAQTAELLAAQATVLRQVLGPTSSLGGTQAPQLRLTAERRQLEQTRRDDPAGKDIVDCAPILGRLLGLWPSDLSTRTDSLVVAPESIALRVVVATMADAQRLADALRALPGWQLQQPQSEAQRDTVTVGLRFLPEGGGP